LSTIRSALQSFAYRNQSLCMVLLFNSAGAHSTGNVEYLEHLVAVVVDHLDGDFT